MLIVISNEFCTPCKSVTESIQRLMGCRAQHLYDVRQIIQMRNMIQNDCYQSVR